MSETNTDPEKIVAKTEAAPVKRRGRPPGSKNKPKLDAEGKPVVKAKSPEKTTKAKTKKVKVETAAPEVAAVVKKETTETVKVVVDVKPVIGDGEAITEEAAVE